MREVDRAGSITRAPDDKLELTATDRELIGGMTPVEGCPSSEIAPLSGLVPHAWPIALKLPGESLSTRTISAARAFKLTLDKVEAFKTEPYAVLNGAFLHREQPQRRGAVHPTALSAGAPSRSVLCHRLVRGATAGRRTRRPAVGAAINRG